MKIIHAQRKLAATDAEDSILMLFRNHMFVQSTKNAETTENIKIAKEADFSQKTPPEHSILPAARAFRN